MDWKLFLNNARKGFSEFNNVSPETFEGFSKMGKPVKRNGELTERNQPDVPRYHPGQGRRIP